MKALRELLKSVSSGIPLASVRQVAQNAHIQPPISVRTMLDFHSPDWWMYHHDERHTGNPPDGGNLNSNMASGLKLMYTSPALDQPVNTVPSIVHGKVYVGTYNQDQSGTGTMYKIDLYTGNIDLSFLIPVVNLNGQKTYATGVGGSPALVDGRLYFTNIPGRVYCLDPGTFAVNWVTDLRAPDPAHNQPVKNDNADCFGSPLVVNGKVYIGCGEGENNAWGFVYCLDALSGKVLWLFCTNQFFAGVDNSPCAIPSSAIGISPLPSGFFACPDPPQRGASVWSSCAYDNTLNRIYVGTGNSSSGVVGPGLDVSYGSGVLALDADSGQFRGFYGQMKTDSYRPGDNDADVASSPTILDQGSGTRVVVGSKTGAFFVFDGSNLGSPLSYRQLLPTDTSGNPLPTVDQIGAGGENKWGVFGTAAWHPGLGNLYVGLGGYEGIGDQQVTPFLRVLDSNTLRDAWPTHVRTVEGSQVSLYTAPTPPLYTSGEAGLSSPAVINDLVFVSTSKPALYAMDAATGALRWIAPGLDTLPSPTYVLGPALYGNYVVIGAGNHIFIYSFPA